MEVADKTITFRYPNHLRYVLRGSVPAIVAGFLLFSLSHGWNSDDLFFTVFCAIVGVTWWWAFRRYGLSVMVDDTGLHFARTRTVGFAPWKAISAVQFSVSGVSITVRGRTWRVLSDLINWDEFERLLRDRASAEALAAWLVPPFRVRTKWSRILQPALACFVFLNRRLRQISGRAVETSFCNAWLRRAVPVPAPQCSSVVSLWRGGAWHPALRWPNKVAVGWPSVRNRTRQNALDVVRRWRISCY